MSEHAPAPAEASSAGLDVAHLLFGGSARPDLPRSMSKLYASVVSRTAVAAKIGSGDGGCQHRAASTAPKKGSATASRKRSSATAKVPFQPSAPRAVHVGDGESSLASPAQPPSPCVANGAPAVGDDHDHDHDHHDGDDDVVDPEIDNMLNGLTDAMMDTIGQALGSASAELRRPPPPPPSGRTSFGSASTAAPAPKKRKAASISTPASVSAPAPAPASASTAATVATKKPRRAPAKRRGALEATEERTGAMTKSPKAQGDARSVSRGGRAATASRRLVASCSATSAASAAAAAAAAAAAVPTPTVAARVAAGAALVPVSAATVGDDDCDEIVTVLASSEDAETMARSSSSSSSSSSAAAAAVTSAVRPDYLHTLERIERDGLVAQMVSVQLHTESDFGNATRQWQCAVARYEAFVRHLQLVSERITDDARRRMCSPGQPADVAIRALAAVNERIALLRCLIGQQ